MTACLQYGAIPCVQTASAGLWEFCQVWHREAPVKLVFELKDVDLFSFKFDW